MAHETLPESAELLNLLSQPVWFVRQGQVVFCNDAAAVRMDPGRLVPEALLTPDALEVYRTWDGAGTLELTAVFDGIPCGMVVRRQGEDDVFAVRLRIDDASLPFQALTAVGRAMRADLSALFDAASELFPRLEELEDPRIQHQTARMSQGLYRLLRLAGNLSDAGGYMAGEVQGLLERTELKEFFEALHRDMAPLFELTGARLTFDGLAAPLWAAVDRQKLRRAVRNLLANALHGVEPGGVVQMRIEDYGHAVYVRITDNGSGMAPARMATAFDGCEVSEDARDNWGAGLGLPLVRHIAALHGGTVVLNSQPGEGTTVTLSLSTRLEPSPAEEVRNPVRGCDYAGGYNADLLELSDILPPEAFDSRNLY